MSFDIHDHVIVEQFGTLTGQRECEISGRFIVDGSDLYIYPYTTFPLNKEIRIQITEGLQSPILKPLPEDFRSWFTTRMHPMYSSYILVRQTGGALLDSVLIDTINREIYHISLIVDSITPVEITSQLPWYVTRFVTCRVAYGLLTGVMEGLAVDGVRSKTLGDFSVETHSDIGALFNAKLDELRDCIKTTSGLIVNAGLPYAGVEWGVRAKTMFERVIADITRWPLRASMRKYEERPNYSQRRPRGHQRGPRW